MLNTQSAYEYIAGINKSGGGNKNYASSIMQ